MKMHNSITLRRLEEAIRRSYTNLDNPGFCVKCGSDYEGCEPDAREYKCDQCGENAVYGAEELLFSL